MTVRELMIRMGYEVDDNSRRRTESDVNSLKSFAKKALGAISVVFAASGIKEFGQQCIQAAADAEALKSQFSQVFGEVEKEASSKLNKIAEDTGIVENRLKGSFTQIAAFAKTTGMEAPEALALSEEAMKAVADSAAFYDRELETVTASLQSFMKGNFENDAALGLSCTETTRNAAANKLYGKSFKDLSEAQKQMTLLQMVKDANAASGALGQAKRESDTWTNQMGNLKQAVEDFKAVAGGYILQPAIKAIKTVSGLVQDGKEKLEEAKPTIDKIVRTVTSGFSMVARITKTVIDKFGGLSNVIQLVAVALITLKLTTLISKLGGVAGIVTKVKTAFQAMNFAILKTVAIVIVIFLLLQDFIFFMQGKDSLLGRVFDKLGINSDEVRKKIIGAFTFVKDKLLEIFDYIKKNVMKFVDNCKEEFEDFKKTAQQIFESLKKFWKEWGPTIIAIFMRCVSGIKRTINNLVKIIKGIVDFVTGILTGDWKQAWEGIKTIFWAFVDQVVNIVSTFIDNVVTFFKKLWPKIKKIIGNFVDKVKEKFGEVKDSIKQKLDDALSFFKNLKDEALEWGKDMIDGFIDGIKEKAEALKDSVKEIGNNIKKFLHFSRPDEGPLVDYETWMPDMMEGLAVGISDNQDVVLNKIRNLADGIRLITRAATADVSNFSNVVNRNSRVVTQNVNISNSYSGSDKQAQMNMSKAMDKSAYDATTYLAKALSQA